VIAWALGVTTTVSWGIVNYAFSVFLQPMEADLGWTRGQLTGAFTLALLVSGFTAMPLGHWIDRHGARGVMTAGSCAGTVLILAWAGVHNLVAFYALWVALGVVMAATLYDPAFAVLAAWFNRQRARALMLVTLMAGLASTIFLPLAAWLVEVQGWRIALVTLAVILAVTTIPPHALLLRRRPADLGLRPDGDPLPAMDLSARSRSTEADRLASLRSLAKHGPFLWLVTAYCLYGVASVGAGVHLVPYLIERGFAPTMAAAATGAVGLAQLAGRLAFAPLEGKLSRRWLAAMIFAAQPVALIALLLGGGSAVALYAFIFLFGISRGAATLSRATLVAARYGAARYGAVNGALSLPVTIANALAPAALGASHDAAGAYEPAFWVLVGLSVLAAGAAVMADPPER
jgi:MFS family permease